MIYENAPKDFNPIFEVVSCFVEYNGEILLLHRQDHKPEPDTFGVPAGKLEHKEKIEEAILRELKQETGIVLIDKPFYFKKIFVRYPAYDFIYHIYHLSLKEKPNILINPQEHKAFQWIAPKDALALNLIQDLDLCIKLFFDSKTSEIKLSIQ